MNARVVANFTLEKSTPETQAGSGGLQVMQFDQMATQTKNWFKSALQTAAFYGAFFIFATAGSLVSVICLLPAILFVGGRARFFGQRLIHALFRSFVEYLRAFGLIKLDPGELSGLRGCDSLMVVANHPCLLDAVLLVSQIPSAVCLMKGSLARNVIFAGTAQLAGYIHNKSGLGLVKKCAERLKEGANLLVFPEGTRTVGGKLLPFKMGFALVAVLTQSPVQTVIISTGSDCLGKGWPLFKKPAFPVHYSLQLGRRFQPEPGTDAKSFGVEVEKYFKERLLPPGTTRSPATTKQ